MAKIIVSFEYPPIPCRNFDYAAYRDGNEECGPVGWGATRAEAVMDLIDMESDGVICEGGCDGPIYTGNLARATGAA